MAETNPFKKSDQTDENPFRQQGEANPFAQGGGGSNPFASKRTRAPGANTELPNVARDESGQRLTPEESQRQLSEDAPGDLPGLTETASQVVSEFLGPSEPTQRAMQRAWATPEDEPVPRETESPTPERTPRERPGLMQAVGQSIREGVSDPIGRAKDNLQTLGDAYTGNLPAPNPEQVRADRANRFLEAAERGTSRAMKENRERVAASQPLQNLRERMQQATQPEQAQEPEQAGGAEQPQRDHQTLTPQEARQQNMTWEQAAREDMDRMGDDLTPDAVRLISEKWQAIGEGWQTRTTEGGPEDQLRQDTVESMQNVIGNVPTAPLRSAVAGVAQAGGDTVSLLSRGAEWAGLVEPGGADTLNRVSGEFGKAVRQSNEEAWTPEMVNNAVQGATRSITNLVTARGAGRAVGARGRASEAASIITGFAANAANQAITEGRDAGLKGRELFDYAVEQGAIEGLITTAFQRAGLGGLESMKAPAREGIRAGLRQLGIRSLAEVPEELIIEMTSQVHNNVSGVNEQNIDPRTEEGRKNLFDMAAQTTLTTLATVGLAEGGQRLSQRMDDARQRRQEDESPEERQQQADFLQQRARETEQTPRETQVDPDADTLTRRLMEAGLTEQQIAEVSPEQAEAILQEQQTQRGETDATQTENPFTERTDDEVRQQERQVEPQERGVQDAPDAGTDQESGRLPDGATEVGQAGTQVVDEGPAGGVADVDAPADAPQFDSQAIADELAPTSHLNPIVERAARVYAEEGPERGQASLDEMLQESFDRPDAGEVTQESVDQLSRELDEGIRQRVTLPEAATTPVEPGEAAQDIETQVEPSTERAEATQPADTPTEVVDAPQTPAEAIAEPDAPTTTAEPEQATQPAETPSREQLEAMNGPQLREMMRERGISKQGRTRKADFVDAILEDQATQTDTMEAQETTDAPAAQTATEPTQAGPTGEPGQETETDRGRPRTSEEAQSRAARPERARQRFSRRNIRQRLSEYADALPSRADEIQLRMDTDPEVTIPPSFQFDGDIPTEVLEAFEGREIALRRLVQGGVPSGRAEDFIGELDTLYPGEGHDIFVEMVEEMIGGNEGRIRRAEQNLLNDPTQDPQLALESWLDQNIQRQETRPRQSTIDPKELPDGATFEMEGEMFAVESDSEGRWLVHERGEPAFPIDGLEVAPMDEGTLNVPETETTDTVEAEDTPTTSGQMGLPGVGPEGAFDAGATGATTGALFETQQGESQADVTDRRFREQQTEQDTETGNLLDSPAIPDDPSQGVSGFPLKPQPPSDPVSNDPTIMEAGVDPLQVLNVQPVDPQASRKPISSPEVINALQAVLEAAGTEVPIRIGRFNQKALGVFKVGPEVIRLRQANNIPVAAHEVAHALEKAVYGFPEGGPWVEPRANTTIQRELDKLGRALYGERKPAGGYKREGFAEFVRMWVTQPDTAQQQAPNFHRWFNDTFLNELPEVRKALDNARTLARRWDEQGAVARARATVVDTARPAERFRRFVSGAREAVSRRGFIDMGAPIDNAAREAERLGGRKLQPSEDPFYIYTALRTTAPARVKYMVEDRMIDLAGNPVGSSLQEAASIVKGKRKDFLLYLYAKRAEALITDPQGARDPGMTLEDAQEVIGQLETPQFQLAAQKVYDWNQGVLNYVGQASPTFAEAVKNIRERDPGNYVPLSREMEEIGQKYAQATRKGQGGSPMSRLRGSGRRVKDPIQTMITNAERMVGAAHKRMVLDAMIKLSHQEGMGHIIEEVPVDQVPGATQSIGQLIDQMNRDLAKRGRDSEVTLEGEANAASDLVTMFVPAQQPKGQDPIIPMRDGDGKLRWYQFDESLYRTLGGMDLYRLGFWGEIFLGKPASYFRAGTTGLRASFNLVTNPTRDFQTLYTNSQASANGGQLLKSWLGSLINAATYEAAGRTSDEFDAFRRLGGEMARMLNQDMANTRRLSRRVFEGRVVRTIDPKNWFDAYRSFVQLPESAARVAELKRVAKDIGWKPGEPMTFDQSLHLLRAAKEVTTDFAAAGEHARAWNRAVPFFNAGIQGPRAAARAIKRGPAKYAFRGMLISAATLLLWWKNKDEDWWKEMPAKERFLYWHIPIGDDTLIRIPRAFEVGAMFAALPESLADSWYNSNPDEMKAWFANVLDTMIPGVEQYPIGEKSIPGPELPVLAREFASQIANRDFFFDSPIVPMGEEFQPAPEQYNEYTTDAAIMLGEMFNVSPRRLDHGIRGVFGPVAMDLLDVTGLGRSFASDSDDLANTPIVGRLFQRGGKMPSRLRSVNKLYETLDEARRVQQSTTQEETPEQRQRRLMMSDAIKAISALSFVRRNTENVEQKRELHLKIMEIAREALTEGEKDRVNRSSMRSTQRRATRMQEVAEREQD